MAASLRRLLAFHVGGDPRRRDNYNRAAAGDARRRLGASPSAQNTSRQLTLASQSGIGRGLFAANPSMVQMGQQQLRSYTEKGNEINVWKMVQISAGMTTDPIKSDGSGNYSGYLAITNAMCSRMTQLAGIYGKVRIRSLRFVFQPIQGVATAGQSIAYIEYNGAAAVTTLANASLKQGCVGGPIGARLVVEWHRQDNKDDEFVTTVQTANMNSGAQHRLVLVTQDTPAATPLYYLYVDGVFDYCAKL